MFRKCKVPYGLSSNDVVVERGRHLCLFEIWEGRIERTVNITVEPGGSCVFVALNNADSAQVVERGTVKEEARLHWINVTSGLKVQHTLESHVCGAHGTSVIDWVCLGAGTASQYIAARNIFDAPFGRGETTIFGAALDEAHIQCDGRVDISCSGDGTETRLCERVLILDPKASVRVLPCMDVRTNNVKASHTATVSRLTDDDLFYFGSRGIARDRARQMLVEGFLGEIINRIPDVNLRKRIVKGLFPKTGSRGPQSWGTPLKGKGPMGETVGFHP